MSYLARDFSHEAEVRLLRWSDSPRGATITVELPPIEIGAGHPFKGLEGVRFRMRFDPIRDDGTVGDDLPTADDVRGILKPAKDEVRAERVEKTSADARNDTPSSKSDVARDRYRQQDEMEQARTRAALLCKDEVFQDWMISTDLPRTEENAAKAMKQYLSVTSRSQIATKEAAYQRFLTLETDWKIRSGQLAEPR